MPRHYRKKRTTRRKLRINGRGLFSWIKKAAKWAAPHLKKAFKIGSKAFNDPRVRDLATAYGPAGTDKMIKKADRAVVVGSLLKDVIKGDGRRRVRIRRRGRGLGGRGLGGRGLGGRP